jgi:flavin-dependent dehydrogenase
MLTSVAGESGAAVLLNSEVSEARWFADHWRIKVRTRNKNGQNFRTRFVVDATGRTASFAKHQGAQPLLLDKLVGSFVFFALSPNTPPPDTYTLVEACEHGWWYVALLPDARLVAAFFSDADIIQTHRLHSFAPWYALLQETSYARVRLATAAPLGEPRVYVAWSQHLDRVYGEGWLAVGDTVSTFDPLSSQGIFKALRSGIYASRAIHDWLGGETRRRDRYQALMQEEFTEYLDIRAAYYRQEQRWAAAAFWRRRHEVISLAPTQILQRIEQQNDTRAIRRGTTGLSETALVLLLALCTNPRTASEIVTLFQRQMPGVASDRRVILALQRLCEAGLIWSADESNRTFTTP